MKKSSLTLLAIASASIIMMTGILIGRYTSSNQYRIADIPAEVAPTVIDESSTLGKININTATLAQFDDLPGVGPVLAQRIVDYRAEHGSFSTLEDLLNVDGIGETRLNKIKDYITTGG